MKRTIKYMVITIIATCALVSCDDGLSLQRYFVDNQESKDFIVQDFPVSMLSLDESNFTAEQKEAYKTVERLNFLGYKLGSDNVETYNTELTKVKAILRNAKYNELVDFNYQGAKISVKYIGDDDKADEVVVFGSSNDMGFGIVRILGKDMSPDKMMTLASIFDTSKVDEAQLDNVMNFFK